MTAWRGGWWPVAVVGMLVTGSGCTDGDDDDDHGADGDIDGDADADGDVDRDREGDGGSHPYPRCDDTGSGVVSVYGRGDRGDRGFGDGRTMFVTRSGPDGITVAEDYACDPRAEAHVFMDFADPPAEAWLAGLGRQVVARLWESWDTSYAELRSPEGLLIWEGGTVSQVEDGRSPTHFRVTELPDAVACTPDDLPADDLCCCALRAPAGVAVSTDDGNVALSAGESRLVTIEGEQMVAVVVAAADWIALPCIDDPAGGRRASVYLARTGALDLPLAEPGPPAADDCPADRPTEWDPCTTRAGLQCDYDWGDDCVDSTFCEGCFWRVRVRGGGPGCGFDPDDCMTNGNDGACSEEAVCTDCSCPDPIGERWRCVWPGDACPACE